MKNITIKKGKVNGGSKKSSFITVDAGDSFEDRVAFVVSGGLRHAPS